MALTDLMPVGRREGAAAHDYVGLVAPNWLVRRVEGVEGNVPLEVTWRPAPGFASREAVLRAKEASVEADDAPGLFAALAWKVEGRLARAEISLGAGEQACLVLAANALPGHSPLERAGEMERVTHAFWQEWTAYDRYRGPWREMVARSALALKLLTYAPSGALVAAATTSLPETPGGARNWDYRFSWLRDSSFVLYALAALGYGGEARSYVRYLERCIRGSLPDVRIMYGIEAENRLDERVLNHLDGYAGSRPVRTGNGAWAQRQLDVYGQVLDLACLYEILGGKLDRQTRRLLEALAEAALREWRIPDHGIWEMRGPPRHHVHGKLMIWVAMDRAARLLGRRDFAAAREEILEVLREQGVTGPDGPLVQALGGSEPDAATLLAPMLGVPLSRATLAATVELVERRLRHGDFVYRYLGEDGLEGEEGAFLICSFWLVDALLCAGRSGEARTLFERLLAQANDVGLYAEEIDPASGAFLGNFPQAFTHLALIGAAVNLELHAGGGAGAVEGSYADRAKRAVGAVFGWRGILAAMRACRRVGRLRSSPRSILLWP
ncbi:glycoside hydrolase family 15 protein [Geminicoccaceae bacterium 1502E]|nr:glycoside hydrolase family 15 protein [Geminicoccaceae bacterium 1502E]